MEGKSDGRNISKAQELNPMKKQDADLTGPILKEARRVLVEIYPPRIAHCLKLLSEEEIWWRPNRASNSIGNLVLHLQGNVRQWIICGLGGQTDRRDRDREFAETGPIPRRTLLAGLQKTVKETDQALTTLIKPDLLRMLSIQGFDVTGLQALCHVAEHFAFHAGQIIFVTKLKCGKDLKFTRLSAQRKTTKKT
jgi:uncharacterized damage-inducible protein DinB